MLNQDPYHDQTQARVPITPKKLEAGASLN